MSYNADYKKKYDMLHRKEIKSYSKKYYKENKSTIKNRAIKWYTKNKNRVLQMAAIRFANLHPWEKILLAIKSRLVADESYIKKGIKNFLTLSQVKKLWFRDKANEMSKPSIDRIDSMWHYSIENCRFIEFIDNCRRPKIFLNKEIV